MNKYYVLDTNVLLHDPQALFKFEDNEVIVPITVIEEIDRFKKDQNETGRNARHVSRYLDGLRKTAQLCEGVKIESGRLNSGPIVATTVYWRLPSMLKASSGPR